MAIDQNGPLDASDKSKHSDLPPIQTNFKEKYLEPLNHDGSITQNSIPSTSNRTTRGVRRLNAKSSILNLFGKSKIEKQQEHNEPGYAVTSPFAEFAGTSPSLEAMVRESLLTAATGPQPLYPRPSTSLSVRDYPRRLRVSEDLKERHANSTLPSLFDIYSDSSKVSMAQAVDESGASRLTRPRKSNASHIIPVHLHDERRDSADSIRDEHRVSGRNGRNSVNQGPFHKMIFALSNGGLILQYSETGGGERLPERVLQLEPQSVAFACDLVPGRPYVLQVDQKPTVQSEQHSHHSPSLLTKMGLKDNLPRVGENSMLLILESAEELTSWMNAVRKQILILATAADDVETSVFKDKPNTTAPKLQVRHGVSVGQQDQPSFTNFSFPKTAPDITTDRPRRQSAAALTTRAHVESSELYSRPKGESKAAISRKPVPERDGIERLRKKTSFDTTDSYDSPLSAETHDSAVSFGMGAGKRMMLDTNASQRSSIESVNGETGDSHILPRSMTTGHIHRPIANPVIDRPRPDSFVADLALLWPARKFVEGATNQQTSKVPSKRLPLKVDLALSNMSLPPPESLVSCKSPTEPPTRALPALPSPRTIENFSRKPQRTPPAKLSLFPCDHASIPTFPTYISPFPSPPANGTTRSVDRPVHSSASIQIRSDEAPVITQVRPMNSMRRPKLSTSESVPCLRDAMTLPRPAMVKSLSSSPLPPLDLGMPIVGLAPPAPPPSLPLPKLPPGAQLRAMAI
jgi:hypothetical protein